jgi:hypothetical protein
MVMADIAAASMAAPTRDRRVYDFGGRLWGSPLGGLRYEAEGHGQAGRNEGLNHRAWAWAANLSYTRESKRVKPGGKIGYAMASGSRCTGSSAAGVANCGAATSSDFFNFYPTNHIHYGLVDLLGWRNMRDLEVSGSLAVDWFSPPSAITFSSSTRPLGAGVTLPAVKWVRAGTPPTPIEPSATNSMS